MQEMENKNYIPTTPLYDCADNHGTQLNWISSDMPQADDDNVRHRESELGDYSRLSHSGSLSKQLSVSNQKPSSETAQLYAAPYEVVNKESDNTRSTLKVSSAICQQETAWCSTIEKVSLFMLLILILIFLVSILGVVLSKNGTSGTDNNGAGLTLTSDTCTDKYNEVLLAVNQILDSKYLFLRPASCDDINRILPNSPSGYYYVNINKTVYCNMEELCGEEGGWTRLGYLNMSDPTEDCPANFEARIFQDNIRACRKTEYNPGCSGLNLSTNGISYTQICGRVIGYQKGETDAFVNHHNVIDSNYLDGVSITRRSEPREHVWSFISGKGSTTSSGTDCPCNNGSAVQVPSFIKDHYYCESGNNDGTQIDNSKFYPDPLWDGEDCPSVESPCCTSKNLPWFHRVYNASSSSDIELRVCRSIDRSNEDILIELYEIYIK